VTIAVASRDGTTVAGHIGKCRDWILFEVVPGNAEADPVVNELERIELAKALVFHHYKDDQPHPLADCAAVIGASAGESFVRKMARRGIEAILTAEPDPATAVQAWVEHNVTPPKPRPIGELFCKLRDAMSSDS
jgi:2-polyprenyl-6-methoxyphenol hydroxylase-like FAD-dependent oxidoreductase